MGSYAGFWFFCPAQKNNALSRVRRRKTPLCPTKAQWEDFRPCEGEFLSVKKQKGSKDTMGEVSHPRMRRGDVPFCVRTERNRKNRLRGSKRRFWLAPNLLFAANIYEGPFKSCLLLQFGALRLSIWCSTHFAHRSCCGTGKAFCAPRTSAPRHGREDRCFSYFCLLLVVRFLAA